MSHGAARAPTRIVLIGFMAAGKSTVGARLATRLGWEFLDFDREIQQRTGRPSGALIRERGEEAFRDLEAAMTEEAAGRNEVVLAPGGGWATRPELAAGLGPGTIRVWLRISAEEAVRRAEGDGVDRPLLGPPGGRVGRAAELLEGRRPLYERAELTVDVDGRAPGVVVDEIVRRLGLEREGDER